MAYSAAVTVYGPYIANGRRYWQAECSETDAAATSEWSFDAGVGRQGIITVMHFVCVHDSGTGSTVQPAFGVKTGLAAIDTRGSFSDAAADVSDASPVCFALDDADSKVYVRSKVDSGANNSITTRICWAEGGV